MHAALHANTNTNTNTNAMTKVAVVVQVPLGPLGPGIANRRCACAAMRLWRVQHASLCPHATAGAWDIAVHAADGVAVAECPSPPARARAPGVAWRLQIISLGIGDTTEPLPQFIADAMAKAAAGLATREGYSG